MSDSFEVRITKESAVIQFYGGVCILHRHYNAVTIHHDPPRSLNPQWEDQPETWFPICYTCHEKAHDTNRSEFSDILRAERDRRFPNVKDKLYELEPFKPK